METVRKQPQKTGQMRRRVKQIAPHALRQVAADDLEELLHQNRTFHFDALRQKIEQRLSGLRIDADDRLKMQLLRTIRTDGGVIRQDDRLLGVVDGERVGMFQQELAEFVEMLAGNVTYFRTGLRTVPQKAADGHFRALAVLGELLGEVLHRLGGVVGSCAHRKAPIVSAMSKKKNVEIELAYKSTR